MIKTLPNMLTPKITSCSCIPLLLSSHIYSIIKGLASTTIAQNIPIELVHSTAFLDVDDKSVKNENFYIIYNGVTIEPEQLEFYDYISRVQLVFNDQFPSISNKSIKINIFTQDRICKEILLKISTISAIFRSFLYYFKHVTIETDMLLEMIRQCEPQIFFPIVLKPAILNINQMASQPLDNCPNSFYNELLTIAIDLPKHLVNANRDLTSLYFQQKNYNSSTISKYSNERSKILNDCTAYRIKESILNNNFHNFCEIIEDEFYDLKSQFIEFNPPIFLTNEFTTLMSKIVDSINLAHRECYATSENICVLKIDGICDCYIISLIQYKYQIYQFLQKVFEIEQQFVIDNRDYHIDFACYAHSQIKELQPLNRSINQLNIFEFPLNIKENKGENTVTTEHSPRIGYPEQDVNTIKSNIINHINKKSNHKFKRLNSLLSVKSMNMSSNSSNDSVSSSDEQFKFDSNTIKNNLRKSNSSVIETPKSNFNTFNDKDNEPRQSKQFIKSKTKQFKDKFSLLKDNIMKKVQVNKTAVEKHRKIEKLNLNMLNEKDKHALYNFNPGEKMNYETELNTRIACVKLLNSVSADTKNLSENDIQVLKLIQESSSLPEDQLDRGKNQINQLQLLQDNNLKEQLNIKQNQVQNQIDQYQSRNKSLEYEPEKDFKKKKLAFNSVISINMSGEDYNGVRVNSLKRKETQMLEDCSNQYESIHKIPQDQMNKILASLEYFKNDFQPIDDATQNVLDQPPKKFFNRYKQEKEYYDQNEDEDVDHSIIISTEENSNRYSKDKFRHSKSKTTHDLDSGDSNSSPECKTTSKPNKIIKRKSMPLEIPYIDDPNPTAETTNSLKIHMRANSKSQTEIEHEEIHPVHHLSNPKLLRKLRTIEIQQAKQDKVNEMDQEQDEDESKGSFTHSSIRNGDNESESLMSVSLASSSLHMLQPDNDSNHQPQTSAANSLDGNSVDTTQSQKMNDPNISTILQSKLYPDSNETESVLELVKIKSDQGLSTNTDPDLMNPSIDIHQISNTADEQTSSPESKVNRSIEISRKFKNDKENLVQDSEVLNSLEYNQIVDNLYEEIKSSNDHLRDSIEKEIEILSKIDQDQNEQN